MWKKFGLIKVLKRISTPNTDSSLYELCKWCSWYQTLKVKTLFGTRIKKPYINCPICGCPTTIIPNEIVYACGVCRRIFIEKFVVSINRINKISTVDYSYECYHCGNSSHITFLHLCGDGELGESDALHTSREETLLGFECTRCHKYIPNKKIIYKKPENYNYHFPD